MTTPAKDGKPLPELWHTYQNHPDRHTRHNARLEIIARMAPVASGILKRRGFAGHRGDAVGEVMERFSKALDRYDPSRANLSTFLRGIVRQWQFNNRKRGNVRIRMLLETDHAHAWLKGGDEDAPSLASLFGRKDDEPVNAFNRAELIRLLNGVLPSVEFKVVWARFFEGRSSVDVAFALKMSRQRVMLLEGAALQRLRAEPTMLKLLGEL